MCFCRRLLGLLYKVKLWKIKHQPYIFCQMRGMAPGKFLPPVFTRTSCSESWVKAGQEYAPLRRTTYSWLLAMWNKSELICSWITVLISVWMLHNLLNSVTFWSSSISGQLSLQLLLLFNSFVFVKALQLTHHQLQHQQVRVRTVYFPVAGKEMFHESFVIKIFRSICENLTVCCNGVSAAYRLWATGCVSDADPPTHTHTHSCALQGDLSSTASPEGELLWGSTVCQLSAFISFQSSFASYTHVHTGNTI